MSRVVHFEIQADDVERAKTFYAAVFGWSFADYSSYTGSTYWGIVTGPEDQPGINQDDAHDDLSDPIPGVVVSRTVT